MVYTKLKKDGQGQLLNGIHGGKLYYHGREQDLTPVHPDSLEAVASHLRHELGVAVRLEPGDGTRYEFHVLPMKSPLLRPSGRDFSEFGGNENWVWVSPINMGCRSRIAAGTVAFRTELEVAYHDLQEIFANPVTCMVISAFLGELRRTYDSMDT